MSRVVVRPKTQAACCFVAAGVLAWVAVEIDPLNFWLWCIPVGVLLISAVAFLRTAKRQSRGA